MNDKGKSTAVAPPKERSMPAHQMFEQDAGMGFEGADSDSFAIPFLVVLQSNSPQVDGAEAIEGARPGMLYNTATQELYDGKEGVLLVPVHFKRQYVEWTPRDQGGGWIATHDPSQMDPSKLEREGGRWKTDSGNDLMDTRYHYCVQLLPDGDTRNVVLSLFSTQIKKSRQWMTKMQTLRMTGKDGKPFTPPTFSHVYQLTTQQESNEKGKWYGVKVDLSRPLMLPEEEGVYISSREFKKQIATGIARVEEPGSRPDAEGDEEVPF